MNAPQTHTKCQEVSFLSTPTVPLLLLPWARQWVYNVFSTSGQRGDMKAHSPSPHSLSPSQLSHLHLLVSFPSLFMASNSGHPPNSKGQSRNRNKLPRCAGWPTARPAIRRKIELCHDPHPHPHPRYFPLGAVAARVWVHGWGAYSRQHHFCLLSTVQIDLVDFVPLFHRWVLFRGPLV
ncbi:hypothetical protein BKA80DRAFT_269437 [Phyllosticta citrichinensis]